MVNHLMCWESYIYWVLRNNFPHSDPVTRSCDTLVLTASSSSSSSATSPPFFLPWERASWTFLGRHYASFPTRSLALASLNCFPTLPWARLVASHSIQPPTWPSRAPSDLSGLKPDGPTWVSLVWVALDTSLEVQSPTWLFRKPPDLSVLEQNRPLGLQQNSPWMSF